MVELEQILKEHALRYPRMQPTDAVKLIYQNEFGGGHLIRDEQATLRYLRQEYDAVQKSETLPRYEEIGNGLVRVNLAALQAEDLDRLGIAFLRSASVHKGSLEVFLKKLEILKSLTEQGFFSFDSLELDTYLQQYEESGYPMVSHSEAYRAFYAPAYRVARSEYLLDCDE